MLPNVGLGTFFNNMDIYVNFKLRWEMKNLFLVISILSLSFIFIGCNSENQKEIIKEPVETVSELEKVYMEMREIAWTSLDDTAKETVIGNWKDAKVTEESVIPEVQLNGEEKPIKVMKVEFNTSQDRFLGPIGIYIAPSTKEIVSRDIRM